MVFQIRSVLYVMRSNTSMIALLHDWQETNGTRYRTPTLGL